MASYFGRRGDAEFTGELGLTGVFRLGVEVLEATSGVAFALDLRQFPQGGADDLRRVVVTAGFDQLANESLPMGGQCDVHN